MILQRNFILLQPVLNAPLGRLSLLSGKLVILKLLYEISGNEFISRPSNKEFFGLFFRYLSRGEEEEKTEKLLESKDMESCCDFICDDCGKTCEQLKEVYQQMVVLSIENRKLKEQLSRIVSYDEKMG